MLRTTSTSRQKIDFQVLVDDREVTTFETTGAPEMGGFRLDEVRYRATRDAKGTFRVLRDGELFCEGRQGRAGRRRVGLTVGEHEVVLRGKSPFRRTLVIERDGVPVGEVKPQGLFSRDVAVETAADLPTDLQIVLVWVAILLWDDRADRDRITSL